MNKRPRGRPRNKPNTIPGWQFLRAVMVLSAYDQARAVDGNYSGAVAFAVQSVRSLFRPMRISETEVKRILSKWRPRENGMVLCPQPTAIDEKDVQLNRLAREQLASWKGKKGLTLPNFPSDDRLRMAKAFTIRIAERPTPLAPIASFPVN